MAPEVSRTVTVRRPREEVAAVIADPGQLFPLITGFGRFKQVALNAATHTETWDIFLDVGTLHVGGRAEVSPDPGEGLSWTSQRGTRSHGRIDVRALNDRSCEITMRVSVKFAGIIVVKLVDLAALSILGRHVEAALQQVRHFLEHGESPPVVS